MAEAAVFVFFSSRVFFGFSRNGTCVHAYIGSSKMRVPRSCVDRGRGGGDHGQG